MKKIYCDCMTKQNFPVVEYEGGKNVIVFFAAEGNCPTCAGIGYTLQGCSNCHHQDGKIGGTAIDVKDGEIIETDATQYHCSHHEQYLPTRITCEEWRAKE